MRFCSQALRLGLCLLTLSFAAQQLQAREYIPPVNNPNLPNFPGFPGNPGFPDPSQPGQPEYPRQPEYPQQPGTPYPDNTPSPPHGGENGPGWPHGNGGYPGHGPGYPGTYDPRPYPYVYLRCTATGWDLNPYNQLQATSTPGVYAIRINLYPGQWVDTCALVATQQYASFDYGYITASVPYGVVVRAGGQSYGVQFGGWTEATFKIEYPREGAYVFYYDARQNTIFVR